MCVCNINIYIYNFFRFGILKNPKNESEKEKKYRRGVSVKKRFVRTSYVERLNHVSCKLLAYIFLQKIMILYSYDNDKLINYTRTHNNIR